MSASLSCSNRRLPATTYYSYYLQAPAFAGDVVITDVSPSETTIAINLQIRTDSYAAAMEAYEALVPIETDTKIANNAFDVPVVEAAVSSK